MLLAWLKIAKAASKNSPTGPPPTFPATRKRVNRKVGLTKGCFTSVDATEGLSA
jgi:hypothetical protein